MGIEGIPDELDQDFKDLVRLSAARSLPGKPLKEPTADTVDSATVSRLISAASQLALSDDSASQNVSYEILTRLLELNLEQFQVGPVAHFILARLGNFPARTLLERTQPEHSKGEVSPYLLAEEIARSLENTVTVGGSEHQLTDFQVELLETLNSAAAASVSAPTSAGKSFVIALHVTKSIAEGHDGAIVVIVPTRALIRQTTHRLRGHLRAAGYVDVPVRCVPVAVGPAEGSSQSVFVLTQERLLTLLHSNDAPPPVISTLLVDEIQELGSGSRGVLLQLAIETVLSRFPSCRPLFFGPQIANPSYTLDLFDQNGPSWVETHGPVGRNLFLVSKVSRKKQQIACSLIYNGEKLPLDKHLLPFEFRGSLREKIANFAVQITRPNECTLVYCNRPSEAEKIAAAIADLIPQQPIAAEVQALIDFINDHIHPDYPLAKLLRKGVAYHYGDMPALVRTQVEELAEREYLPFICCTSTLLQGINLPARHIILRAPQKGVGQPMNRFDFLNLAGRAGRLMKEFHGNVWCVDPDKWEHSVFEGAETLPIQSTFDSSLADGGLVAQRTVDDDLGEDDDQDAAVAVLNKVVADFVLSGEQIESSKYSNNQNVDTLRDTVARCAYLGAKLPRPLLRRNPTVSAVRLLALKEKLEAEPNLRRWIPRVPNHPDFYEALKRIFRLLERELEQKSGDSYTYHALLASKWLRGHSLGQIISSRLTYLQSQGKRPKLPSLVRGILRDIGQVLRFRYVKNLRAFSDLLEYLLRDRGELDDDEEIPRLSLFLEAGTTDVVALALITIGFSRTSALLLTDLLGLREAPDEPEELIQILRNQSNLLSVRLPAVCLREVEQII